MSTTSTTTNSPSTSTDSTDLDPRPEPRTSRAHRTCADAPRMFPTANRKSLPTPFDDEAWVGGEP